MGIPHTIYMNNLEEYRILFQSSLCWPQERRRLHWQFHRYSQRKKNIKGIQIPLPLVFFPVPSSLASVKVRSDYFILHKGLP